MSDYNTVLPKADADRADAIVEAVLDAIDRDAPPNRDAVLRALAREEYTLIREPNRLVVRVLNLEVTVDLVSIGRRRLDA